MERIAARVLLYFEDVTVRNVRVTELCLVYHICTFTFVSLAAICSQPCRNGGVCIGVNQCDCAIGYEGRYCQSGQLY